MIKFMHMADVHLDMPFTSLNKEKGLSAIRRKEQRDILKSAIDKAVEEEVDFILIAGDLFEYSYVRKSTIEYIIDLFGTTDIPIFISPGNHDPFTKDSYYATCEWPKNVHIFSTLERIKVNDINIYGKGFTSIKEKGEELINFKVENSDEINIVLTHATLDLPEPFSTGYNPVTSAQIKRWGADYIALGHIHKRSDLDKNIIYPGSLLSLGFDEAGEHGAIITEIDKRKRTSRFVKLDFRICESLHFDYTEKCFEGEVIKLLEKDLKEYSSRNFMRIEIDISSKCDIEDEVIEYLLKERFEYFELKVNKIQDYEEIAQEKNVKGLFVKKMLKRVQEGDESAEMALKIGLKALEGK